MSLYRISETSIIMFKRHFYQFSFTISEEMMRQMGGLGPSGAGPAGGAGSGDMGDLSKKVYQRPSLDDLDIEEEEEDDMPDLE